MVMQKDMVSITMFYNIFVFIIFSISLILSMPFIRFSYYNFGIAAELDCIDLCHRTFGPFRQS